MKRWRQGAAALLVFLVLILAGCSPESEQARFDAFLWQIFEDSVTSNTLTLHYTLADPEAFGVEKPEEVTWGEVDFSEQGLAEGQKELENTQKELEGFRYRSLTEEQQLIYDIVEQQLETELDFQQFVDLYEPFAYTSGLQVNIPIMLSEYQFYKESDVEDYLQLLEQMPGYFQAYLDFEQSKAGKGLFMSQANAEEVIRQCREFIQNPQENMLIETFEDRLVELDELSKEQRETYRKANGRAVFEAVIPAYEAIIDTFEMLKTSGRNELGLAHLENGKEYYRYLLASEVGSDKSPEEVIRLLDRALQKTIRELVEAAQNDMEGYLAYAQEEDLYKEEKPEQTIRYFEEAFADRFPQLPAIQFAVTPVHESLQNSVSPAFYLRPALDAYEKNAIYINEASSSIGSLWAMLAHEGIPGHMYQNVYFLAQNPHPVRKVLDFGGYSEGWATYVEMMAYEEYDFENDLYAQLEAMDAKLNLLVSARVEIGVNYEGWDLAETQTFLSELGLAAENAEVMMQYVTAEPANYQMYCLGWLEIEELRAYAEVVQGEQFDETAFHEVVLKTGPSQFNVLQERVEAFVKK